MNLWIFFFFKLVTERIQLRWNWLTFDSYSQTEDIDTLWGSHCQHSTLSLKKIKKIQPQIQVQKHVICRERGPNRSQKWNLQYSTVVFNSCALCIQQHRECQQGAIINIALSVQCAPITIGLSWEKVCTHKRLNPREIISILLLFHQLSATKETREFLWFIIDKQVTILTMHEI